MTSPLLSQRVSNDTCCVPCQALRNALEVKAENKVLNKRLVNARDTISTYREIIWAKDTIITSRDSSIAVYKRNEIRNTEIVNNKDSIINVYGDEIGKQKTIRNVSIGVSIFLAFLLFFTGI